MARVQVPHVSDQSRSSWVPTAGCEQLGPLDQLFAFVVDLEDEKGRTRGQTGLARNVIFSES